MGYIKYKVIWIDASENVKGNNRPVFILRDVGAGLYIAQQSFLRGPIGWTLSTSPDAAIPVFSYKASDDDKSTAWGLGVQAGSSAVESFRRATGRQVDEVVLVMDRKQYPDPDGGGGLVYLLGFGVWSRD